MRLTKRMHDVLKAADLEAGEIHSVPMGTMYGLESRGLVTSEWRMARSHAIQTTCGGTFPRYRLVKLTAAGLTAARNIQGLPARQTD